MVEYFVPASLEPRLDETSIVDRVVPDVGGAAFNTCWYLRQFGWPVELVSVTAAIDRPLLAKAFRRARLSMNRLVEVADHTDVLFSLFKGSGHRSFYLKGRVPMRTAESLLRQCPTDARFVFAGGRHPSTRAAFCKVVASPQTRLLGFNPSYCVYSFSAWQLRLLLKRAAVSIFNSIESRYVCQLLKQRRLSDLATLASGILIVTQGPQGALIFCERSAIRVQNRVRRPVVPLGAGDAFFAGFLDGILRGEHVRRAAAFATGLAARVVRSTQIRIRVAVSRRRPRARESFERADHRLARSPGRSIRIGEVLRRLAPPRHHENVRCRRFPGERDILQ